MIGRVRRQAFAAASQAYAAASDGRDLIADMADGFGVRVTFDAHAVKAMFKLLKGEPGDLPLTITIDPTVDVKPKGQ